MRGFRLHANVNPSHSPKHALNPHSHRPNKLPDSVHFEFYCVNLASHRINLDRQAFARKSHESNFAFDHVKRAAHELRLEKHTSKLTFDAGKCKVETVRALPQTIEQPERPRKRHQRPLNGMNESTNAPGVCANAVTVRTNCASVCANGAEGTANPTVAEPTVELRSEDLTLGAR